MFNRSDVPTFWYDVRSIRTSAILIEARRRTTHVFVKLYFCFPFLFVSAKLYFIIRSSHPSLEAWKRFPVYISPSLLLVTFLLLQYNGYMEAAVQIGASMKCVLTFIFLVRVFENRRFTGLSSWFDWWRTQRLTRQSKKLHDESHPKCHWFSWV